MNSRSFFSNAPVVFFAAFLLRAVLLVYGHYQDQNSALKYTDIDYYVFTDAARYVSRSRSPYERDTYRYTPLLAWMLLPTTWGGLWFDFGKALFALSDLLAGWLAYTILRSSYNMQKDQALKFACLWLLNPMVAQISTRGSSEGLLAVMVMALLWATLKKRYSLAGILLGIAVHFKIYPFIYASAILWWMNQSPVTGKRSIAAKVSTLITPDHLTVGFTSLLIFLALNIWMFAIYGGAFVQHTYLYHLIRTDHRHNFSPYNMLLYLKSSPADISGSHPETLAFIPQMFLSVVAVPLALAKKDLASCMLAQTFSFVAFNKVCTSQYFLWYMVFLPFYLPTSSMLQSPRIGLTALVLWIAGQALWLQQGYQLEFLGHSTFMPGLWTASLLFFAVNIWMLGIIVSDVRRPPPTSNIQAGKKAL